MAWLHNNREYFLDAVNLAAERHNVLPAVVEKRANVAFVHIYGLT